MSTRVDASPGATTHTPSAAATLRRLFLTLFLRGRTSRGLQKATAPSSVVTKLWLMLALYAAFGLFALAFIGQTVLALSAALHAMTFLFLGMFVAASGGEILFNKEEADILLHRPVHPRTLLWAKIRVLVDVSLWLAGALNLVSFFVGTFMPNGSWLFPIAHALSIAVEALFCTGCIVLVYQLCLRWFGRERLEGLMTTAQVLVAVGAAAGGQLAPRLIGSFEGNLEFGTHAWWLALVPPVWFAAFDDAVAGNGGALSWGLAALGVVVTAAVLWTAFGKLAGDYERGLQILTETTTRARPHRAARRWFDVMVGMPPLRWWLRDSVSRAAFLLTVAYLVRDRDMKLRMYPSIAPMVVMPFVFMMGQGRNGGSGTFGLAMTGGFIGLAPLLALSIVRFSQNWQASDIFRVAPIPGPAALCHGARKAVLLVVTLPLLVMFTIVAWYLQARGADFLLAFPGLIALPVYTLVPCLGGHAVPLSLPSEEAKAAGRGPLMLGVTMISIVLSGLGIWAHSGGWLLQMLVVEGIVVAVVYVLLWLAVRSARWTSPE